MLGGIHSATFLELSVYNEFNALAGGSPHVVGHPRLESHLNQPVKVTDERPVNGTLLDNRIGKGFFSNPCEFLFGEIHINGVDIVDPDAFHLEVQIFPCSDASAARRMADEQRAGEVNKNNTGKNMNRVVEFQVQPEAIVGDNCWYAWIVRAEGRLVTKIGFAKGPFYVSILWDASGGRSKINECKPRAATAARHVAGKLN